MGDLRELLWGLAVCDRTAAELVRELTRIPGSIVEVEAKAQAARETIEQERKSLEEAEHTRRVKERELQDCEAKRDKFQSQTAMVKTNAEYTALLHEVDGLTARISQVEEEILIAMETADQILARIETVRREQTQIEQDLLRQAEQLRERMEAVKDEIDARTKQREELLARVSPEIKAHYERIHAVRGIATGQIQGQSCAACHREVPHERINRVLAGEMQTCPTCQRILVVGEA